MEQFEQVEVTAIPEEEIVKNLTGEEREKWITRYQAEYLLAGLMEVEALQQGCSDFAVSIGNKKSSNPMDSRI